MQSVVLLGVVIIAGLVIADWRAFTRRNDTTLRYGIPVARQQNRLSLSASSLGTGGSLRLGHGAAHHYSEHKAIVLLPDLRQFGVSFRTAWPLNGVVYYNSLSDNAEVRFIKRMPWSSAVLTLFWFMAVAGGLITYLVSYARAGGFSSASGTFMAAAVGGLGVLVLLFGIIVVVAAYWLEDKRLMVLYHELGSSASAR